MDYVNYKGTKGFVSRTGFFFFTKSMDKKETHGTFCEGIGREHAGVWDGR